MNAVELLGEGRLDEALEAVKNDIRSAPAEAKHRVFLFQLYCVQGLWDKALDQLNVLRDLDVSTLPMANTYQEALRCEALRAEVFAGRRAPMIMGEPDDWIGILFESNKALVDGRTEAAAQLREQAFDRAEATAGQLNGQSFEWIADADSRLGPVLEAIINGKYYWVPFARLSRVHIEPPEDLRDFVWAAATLIFANGGEVVALLPSRYPGSESAADPQLRLGRRTEWAEDGVGGYIGSGQRLLTTGQDDFALLDVREILIGGQDDAGVEAGADETPS